MLFIYVSKSSRDTFVNDTVRHNIHWGRGGNVSFYLIQLNMNIILPG